MYHIHTMETKNEQTASRNRVRQ